MNQSCSNTFTGNCPLFRWVARRVPADKELDGCLVDASTLLFVSGGFAMEIALRRPVYFRATLPDMNALRLFVEFGDASVLVPVGKKWEVPMSPYALLGSWNTHNFPPGAEDELDWLMTHIPGDGEAVYAWYGPARAVHVTDGDEKLFCVLSQRGILI